MDEILNWYWSDQQRQWREWGRCTALQYSNISSIATAIGIAGPDWFPMWYWAGRYWNLPSCIGRSKLERSLARNNARLAIHTFYQTFNLCFCYEFSNSFRRPKFHPQLSYQRCCGYLRCLPVELFRCLKKLPHQSVIFLLKVRKWMLKVSHELFINSHLSQWIHNSKVSTK